MTSQDLRGELRAACIWRGDRTDRMYFPDVTGWWRDAGLLARLGPALAALALPTKPTVVLGPQSRGSMLGALVAMELGVGLIEVRKSPGEERLADSDAWLSQTTKPDYRNRHLSLGFRRGLLQSGDRAVLIDDWIETGGQALASQSLVEAAGATWCGAAVVVDGLTDGRIRQQLQVRSLLHIREL